MTHDSHMMQSTNAALSAQVERLKEEYEESEKHLKDNLLQVCMTVCSVCVCVCVCV